MRSDETALKRVTGSRTLPHVLGLAGLLAFVGLYELFVTFASAHQLVNP
jgi:hypothetical protein